MGSLVNLIYTAAEIYQYLIIAYILLSFVPNARDSAAGYFLGRIVEPFLAPFRAIIPPIGGVLDISPILAIFALNIAVEGLVYILLMIG